MPLVFTFIKSYWRVILIALAFGIAGSYKTLYERKAHEFEAYKQEQATLTRVAIEKNAIIEVNAERAIESEAKKHKDITDKLNLDRNKLAKDLQNEITLSGNRLSAYADRVRIESGRAAGSEAACDPERPTEAERERDTAYIRTLELAGASCALDYNLARGWIDTVCANYGCE